MHAENFDPRPGDGRGGDRDVAWVHPKWVGILGCQIVWTSIYVYDERAIADGINLLLWVEEAKLS